MMRGKKFKDNRTHTGTMRTKVTFSKMAVGEGFFDEDVEIGPKYSAWAEIYDVVQQDIEELKGRFAKNALALESIKSTAVSSLATVKIRDPFTAYQPQNSDTAVIYDPRYQGRKWEVIDVRPDFYNRSYLIIFLKEL